MDKVSQRAAEILLKQAAARGFEPAEQAAEAAAEPSGRPLRVTRRLAEALLQISELVGPVAEAAQEWLEANDEADRELMAEARASLGAALTDAPELGEAIALVARALSRSRSLT